MTRLIDADALKKALKSNCKPELCHDYNTTWCERCCRTNDFEDLIDEAPTVEERPHGKWEPIEENGTPYWEENYEPMFLCTRCKCKSYKKPFCPHCGADMREGDT